MNWKTRQLFSDREHGIVSGLSPVNMVNGGSVPIPGYEDGGTVGRAVPMPTLDPEALGLGRSVPMPTLDPEALGLGRPVPMPTLDPEKPSIEQQVAALAAQQGISVPEARATILKQMVQEKGLTLSGEVINQFATGVITLQDALAQAVGPPIQGMQTGGLALDLFEEGDEEINAPLNMMAQAVSPSLDVGPTEIEEAVTMDQGPITETVEEISIEEEPGGYEIELQVLKRAFKDDIRSYVSEGGSGELEEYLGKMSVVYGNQLDELKRKYGVTEYSPEEELITPDFMSELESLASVPGFEPGGVNIFDETVIAGMDNDTLQTALNNYFEGKQPVNAKLWRQTASEGRKVLAIRILGGGAGAGTGNGLADALAALKQERMDLASEIGEAGRSGYSSVQDPVSHFFSARKAGKTAELAAKEKVLADQTALLSRLSGGAGAPTSIMDSLTADQSNIITGASDKNYQTEILKNKMKAWSNMMKAAGEARTPKLGLTQIKNYITVYGTPPDGILNATTSDWEGARTSAKDGSLVTWEEYLAILEADEDIKSFADYVNKLAKWLTLDKV